MHSQSACRLYIDLRTEKVIRRRRYLQVHNVGADQFQKPWDGIVVVCGGELLAAFSERGERSVCKRPFTVSLLTTCGLF